MPTPPSRRLRRVLIATCALGAIGLGYAGIASAQSPSDDKNTGLASTVTDTVATGAADAPPSAEPTEATEATEPELPAPSATASLGAKPSAKPSPSATKTSARPKPSTTKKTKRPSPAPAKTTKTSAPSGGGGSVSNRETEVIRLVNVERNKAGCGALTGESRLHAAAQKHSDLQAEKETMSHQLPGEPSMGDRVTAQGYRWGSVAENVAAGYTTAASVMDGWMNSPGHKANILNCRYKHIGVGVKKSAKGTLYWTQNFASPL